MGKWGVLELEIKITLVAMIYAVFKLLSTYVGVVPGSAFYGYLLNACRVIFVASHVWLHTLYSAKKREINGKESLSALSKLQYKKSIKMTMRWIYVRAVVVAAVHICYMQMLPLLICTPLLAFILMNENSTF